MWNHARRIGAAGRRGGTICVAAVMLGLGGCGEAEPAPEHRIAGGKPAEGRALIARLGCGACHRIPGIAGARGSVGPPLDGFALRNLIGGVAPNRPSILIEWVRAAPDLAPDTAMPHLPLSEEEARHVAAYLYTLR